MSGQKISSRKSQSGSAIIAAFWVLLLVAMLASYLTSLCTISNTIVGKVSHDVLAFEAAQAGLANALHELAASSTWTTGFANQPLPDGSARYSISFGSPVPGTAYYSVNNLSGSSAANGYFGSSTVPPGTAQLVSVGSSTGSNGRISRRMLFATVSTQQQSVFPQFAVFASQSLDFSGNAVTDSWNSAAGTYSSTRSNSNAGIGTNGTASGAIDLTGNVVISGDVQVGPGGNVNTSISTGNNVTIQGQKKVATQLIVVPNLTVPGGTNLGDRSYSGSQVVDLLPGVYGSLSASGQAVVRFSSGTYVFLGDVNFTGQSYVQLPSGAVTVYATTSWKTAGNGIVNDNNTPRNFVLIGSQSCHTIRLAGNASAYFGVYAPEADLQMNGNADIFGALICKTFRNVGNGAVHRDIDLSNSPPYVGSGIQVKGWQEL